MLPPVYSYFALQQPMPKAHAFQAWVKAAYLLHGVSFISSASPCLQAWVVD